MLEQSPLESFPVRLSERCSFSSVGFSGASADDVLPVNRWRRSSQSSPAYLKRRSNSMTSSPEPPLPICLHPDQADRVHRRLSRPTRRNPNHDTLPTHLIGQKTSALPPLPGILRIHGRNCIAPQTVAFSPTRPLSIRRGVREATIQTISLSRLSTSKACWKRPPFGLLTLPFSLANVLPLQTAASSTVRLCLLHQG